MSSTTRPQSEDQFQSLLETVERLRANKFPNVDAVLVREILRLHADGGAADGELSRAIEQAVENTLTKVG